ncbi:X-Pro aminopeptidase [Brevirhabdus pacifica]|uniref:X-Pro aminopeptidase n=1 Tax=Brevirhabdus pacifica TaxID=1267768 RepID=A0A1U7DL08_9RHOB|nr:aminopeptidase P family protein [Brevirhabdus pacifica]APX90573.1 X-Pro aminopeptidase [Brevirhabdus pacifica]OWU78429.1 X-Pro aminopeptidase [Loktanella sp. 22II-4b]PJJ85295.1 Xaa-Pro aminopeptidase [Brevirhabdus pacifica]
MFQQFEVTSTPANGPARLARLQATLADQGLDGFLVPKADAHQGEYVAPRDERLAWLTGFTGSAGFAIVLRDRAGVFVDGRYRLQVRAQVALSHFTPVDWPEVQPAAWLREALPEGGTIGFDPWLHTMGEIARLRQGLEGSGILLRALDANPIDGMWEDQPAPPAAAARAHPIELAGLSHEEKRADCARALSDGGARAAVLTQPDSIAWLLNIRGGDIPRVPVMHGFAILHQDGAVDLFAAPAKLVGLEEHLGKQVRIAPPEDFAPALKALEGPVRLDPATAPVAVGTLLEAAGITVVEGADPCALPKARKNAVELEGARAAHQRDGVAMVRFLAWLDRNTREEAAAPLTEIDVIQRLEGFRAESGELRDISFETIAGTGPNGAIVHYRVTTDSNRPLERDNLLLVDSGGQYADGTTDITRTVAIGQPSGEHRRLFTLVLKGMINLSRARWPEGLAGRDLDALARIALWRAGMDYGHGTGHGVGSYLSVHEGPQRLARTGEVALVPGMILSNEPGYYREGAFGIRIENLVVVRAAGPVPGGDARAMLEFETLTLAPIDRALVDPDLLDTEERAWLDAYHAEVARVLLPRLDESDAAWLRAATAPI